MKKKKSPAWIRQAKEMNRTRRENQKLCERYPFLIPWNRFSGMLITEARDGGFWPGSPEKIPHYKMDYTELDAMPTGWRKAFGIQMCEDLRDALVEDGDLYRYRIVQLKEKYGSLNMSDNGWKSGSRVPEIIDRYEKLSERTCICCGRPATRITTGWISPLCDDCNSGEKSVPIDEGLLLF
jgi:hypothetical protein